MWWIIIGAVIALVVMIVLMVMFTGKTGKLGRGMSSCEGKGGICMPKGNDCPQNTLRTSMFDCPSGGSCCVGSPVKADTGCTTKVTDSNHNQWCSES